MSFFPLNRYSRKVILVLVSLAIAVAGLVLVYARPSGTPKAGTNALPAPIANIQRAMAGGPAEVELIDLRPSGFEPHEITRPTGRFLLGVNNRSGLTDLSLVLANESGRLEGSKRLSRMKTWREALDLQPGRYVLREATHSDWLCRITITER